SPDAVLGCRLFRPRRTIRMAQPEPPGPTDRTAARIVALVSFAVPLLYCSRLADPFALPKRAALLAAAVALGALATLRPSRGESERVSAPALWPACLLLILGAIACGRAPNVGLALWGLLDLAAGVLLFAGMSRCVRDLAGVGLTLRAYLVAAA